MHDEHVPAVSADLFVVIMFRPIKIKETCPTKPLHIAMHIEIVGPLLRLVYVTQLVLLP